MTSMHTTGTPTSYYTEHTWDIGESATDTVITSADTDGHQVSALLAFSAYMEQFPRQQDFLLIIPGMHRSTISFLLLVFLALRPSVWPSLL